MRKGQLSPVSCDKMLSVEDSLPAGKKKSVKFASWTSLAIDESLSAAIQCVCLFDASLFMHFHSVT